MGNKARYVAHAPNPKRTSAKKARGFGIGKIGTDDKAAIDAWSQMHDPLFKVKGIERHVKLKATK